MVCSYLPKSSDRELRAAGPEGPALALLCYHKMPVLHEAFHRRLQRRPCAPSADKIRCRFPGQWETATTQHPSVRPRNVFPLHALTAVHHVSTEELTPTGDGWSSTPASGAYNLGGTQYANGTQEALLRRVRWPLQVCGRPKGPQPTVHGAGSVGATPAGTPESKGRGT